MIALPPKIYYSTLIICIVILVLTLIFGKKRVDDREKVKIFHAPSSATTSSGPDYRCEKGHIAKAFFVSIGWSGDNVGINVVNVQTCPICLKEWCEKYLPKVTEVKK